MIYSYLRETKAICLSTSLLISILVFYSSCTSSKRMGTFEYDSTGVSKTKGKLTCPELPKQYSKDFDLRVKTSIDSALKLPLPEIDAALKKNVIKLLENTPEEALQYTLHNICVISNNRGLSNNTTDSLIRLAMETYKQVKLKGNSSNSQNLNINQTNNGILNGNMIGVMQITSEDSFVNKEIEVIVTMRDSLYKIQVFPKKGTWRYPGATVPTEALSFEELHVGVDLSGVFSTYSYSDTIFYSGGRKIPCKAEAIQFDVSRNMPLVFYVKKIPEIFIISDRINKSQVFYVVVENGKLSSYYAAQQSPSL